MNVFRGLPTGQTGGRPADRLTESGVAMMRMECDVPKCGILVPPGRPLFRLISPLLIGCLALGTTCSTPRGPQQLFAWDDFDEDTLDEAWTILREDPSAWSLTARPGFLRIRTQEGGVAEDTIRNLILRGVYGDFTLTTRMEFDPTADNQFAGLAVRGNDGRNVIYGITRLSGARGTFRGLLAIAEAGGEEEADTSGALYAFNDVWLRLIRHGNTFTAQYSRDGAVYTDVGTVSATLSTGVSVGIGAANGQNCGEHCDESVNADFDSFEITVPLE